MAQLLQEKRVDAPERSAVLLRTPLDKQRQFQDVGNSEAIVAGNAISLHIMAFERVPTIR
jgi:hypothetical protein